MLTMFERSIDLRFDLCILKESFLWRSQDLRSSTFSSISVDKVYLKLNEHKCDDSSHIILWSSQNFFIESLSIIILLQQFLPTRQKYFSQAHNTWGKVYQIPPSYTYNVDYAENSTTQCIHLRTSVVIPVAEDPRNSWTVSIITSERKECSVFLIALKGCGVLSAGLDSRI